MKVIGYIRVSTDDQADNGGSLDAQRAKLEAYSSLYELELIEVIVDRGKSASTLDRPGLQIALKKIGDGEADGLLVSKLDRLTRSVRDLCELVERFSRMKVALLSVGEQLDTTSAAGRLVMNILASVAQWEREAIGERTSAVMINMRDQGLYTGGQVRYGYRLTADRKTLEPNPNEQMVVDIARKLRSKGNGLRETARQINEWGYRTRKGTEFQASQIASMAS